MLLLAAENGHTEAARVLVDSKADLNGQNEVIGVG